MFLQKSDYSCNFWLANGGALLFFATSHIVAVSLPLYITSALDSSAAAVGLVTGAMNASSLGARPIASRSIGRYGSRLTLLAGAIIFIVSPPLYFLAHSVGALAIVAILQGIGLSLLTTAHITFVADLAPADRHGQFIGFAGMAMPASLAMFPYIASTTINQYGFIETFSIASIAASISFLAFFMTRDELNEVDSSVIVTDIDSATLMRSGTVLLPALAATTLGVADGAVLSFLPLFAVERSLHQYALFFTLFSISLVAAQGLAGRAVDEWGAYRISWPSLGLMAISFLVLSSAQTSVVLFFAAVLYAIGFGGTQTSLLAVLVAAIPNSKSEKTVSLFWASFDVGRIAGLFVLGEIAEQWGYAPIYVLVAVYTGIFAFCIPFFTTTLDR